MKTLLLMRHAKSSWDDADKTDHDRVLNARGLRDAPRMGQFLCGHDLIPDWIVSSSAVRARSTAGIVAHECDILDRLTVTPVLYHAQLSDWTRTLRELSPAIERVLCVGHNPGLEELISRLTGQHVRMPTAAIAQLDFSIAHWSEWTLDSEVDLVNNWCPEDLE